MTMAPSGEDHRATDRNGSGEHADPRHASWRELAFWYPWVVPVLGLVIAALGIRLFAVITEQVYEHSAVPALDRRLLETIEPLRGPAVITAFNVITYLGDGIIVALVVLTAAVWLGVKARSWTPPALLLTTSVGTGLTVFLIKLTIARPRPVPAPNAATEDSFAFPSGHSAHSAAVYLMLAFLLSRLLLRQWARVSAVIGAVLLVLITGFSRLVLGVHSPSDVVAGWLLGGTFTLVLISVQALSAQLAPLRTRLVERARTRVKHAESDPDRSGTDTKRTEE